MSQGNHFGKPDQNQTKPNVCPKLVVKRATLLPAAVVSCAAAFKLMRKIFGEARLVGLHVLQGLFNL